jgi:succinate dehydrogenase / fumarate reductase cytochrome b subunit
LVLGIVLHVITAVRVTRKNRAARPTKYVKRRYRRSSPAARTMIFTGLIIFAFIAYHLAQFTLHWTNPEYGHMHDALGRHDVYSMVVMGFHNYAISALYIIAVALVCMHLTHGVPSFFQTLGLRHPKYTPLLNFLGIALALGLFVGFCSVPVSVMAHWIKPLGGM